MTDHSPDHAERAGGVCKPGLLIIARRCDAMTPDCEGVEGIDYLGACAVAALSNFPVLARRCSGCAFTPGTEANSTPSTSRSAIECVERAHPFWCHKAEDAEGFKTHLCAGWIDGLAVRAALTDTVRGEGENG